MMGIALRLFPSLAAGSRLERLEVRLCLAAAASLLVATAAAFAVNLVGPVPNLVLGWTGVVLSGVAIVLRAMDGLNARRRRTVRLLVLFAVALVAATPGLALAAGYESRSGGTNTSVFDSISGVPVPGGGTRSNSTSTSSYDNWSRAQPIYNGWERAAMSFGVAREAIATMNFVADGFQRLSGAPQVVAAPPAPVCYPQGCHVWTNGGWQWMPTTQPAPMPTVTVSVGQPVPAYRQCSDGRGFSWLC